VNNGRIRSFTSRNEEAHSSNAPSTATPATHDLRTVPMQQARDYAEMQL
jgi:hypothetical protein